MSHQLNTSLLGLGAALVLAGCNAPDTSTAEAPAAAPASTSAHSEVENAVMVNASADEVWAVAGGFCSLADWHPVVGACTLDGDVRTITTADGAATFTEQETGRDDAAHSYTYTILTGPLPLTDYTGQFRVEATGPAQATVYWSSSFTPLEGQEAAANAALEGIYSSGLAGIAAHFAQ